VDYRFVALPAVVKEEDSEGNDAYIEGLIKTGRVSFGLLTARPEIPAEKIEEALACRGFAGLKPYPDFISKYKGAELSIFDFLPRSHLQAAEKLGKCIVLHLPRAGRFSDPANIRELKQIMDEFPALKLVIAHFGRSFNLCYFEDAFSAFAKDIDFFWFDSAAVMNGAVYEFVFQHIKGEQIFFGLDMPTLLWHGERRWTEKTYFNVCREDLPWNKHIEGKEAEEKYTFFYYKQLNNILNTMEKCGLGEDYKQNFFFRNANAFFSGCTA
jgi:hypothetical protein